MRGATQTRTSPPVGLGSFRAFERVERKKDGRTIARPPAGMIERKRPGYLMLLSSMLSPCAGTSCFTSTCGLAFLKYIICSPSALFTFTLYVEKLPAGTIRSCSPVTSMAVSYTHLRAHET